MSRGAHSIPAACTLAMLAGLSSRAPAEPVAAPGATPTTAAARRFPQPVRVGDLIHRPVLEPVVSRRILGHVERVVRLDAGREAIVMTYGGLWGIGVRRIAVPLEAMALLGSEVEVLDFTPRQLDGFPTYDGRGRTLGGAEIIQMGLAHPAH